MRRDTLSEPVRAVLESADEPLSPGRIQQRIVGEGLDATTGAIAEACETLRQEELVAATGDPPRYYRAAAVDDAVRREVHAVLTAAEGPLSPGRIQQRLADAGMDATTAVIEEVCDELASIADVESVDDA